MAVPHARLLDAPDANLGDRLWDDLLSIADSKLVLGHWYWKVLPNGRELTDFVSLASLTQDELGHTRSIYAVLEGREQRRLALEDRDSPADIRSMEALDVSPRSWGEFVITAWLADGAIWSALAGYAQAGAPALEGLVTKIGREEHYHRLCTEGWVRASAHREEDRAELQHALVARLPMVLRWFGPPEDDSLDVLRAAPLSIVRDQFVRYVSDVTSGLGLAMEDVSADQDWSDFRPSHRRAAGSSISPDLYRILSSADSQLKPLENVAGRA